MSETHRFMDSTGAAVNGKSDCLEAWQGFFTAFPDYRNIFEEADEVGDGKVIARGHSECSFAALDGPAEWCAVVRNACVDVWQVSESASEHWR